MIRTLVVAVAVLEVGCSCGSGPGPGPGPVPMLGGGTAGSNGRVSGKVTPFRGADSVQRGGLVDWEVRRVALQRFNEGRTRVTAPSARLPELVARSPQPVLRDAWLSGRHQPARFLAGELLVRFDEKLTAAGALKHLSSLPGLELRHGGFGSEWLHLIRFAHRGGKALSLEETADLIGPVSRIPGVRFAEKNHLRDAFALPNDNLYPRMWHLPAINLPAAWELERGTSTAVTVAVLDTGIIAHPDLTPRVLPGADLISDPASALDGDGRDMDPTDPGGDRPNGDSSWHGSHCAGTIGAATDNSQGIAGVNWNARLLPVRVLGKGGGSDLDIIAGMTWAVGNTVPGLAANANPAQVVSMSLGGQGEALQAYQDVIDQAATRNVIFVISAGNDDADAARYNPCNQTGVLCIGATRLNGRRASYSNYGARIDLMAPGGEMAEDANGDGDPDGVLSTVKNDMTGMPTYSYSQGTSMAAPHVAGVVSLMKARNPGLTFAQVKDLLTQTANAEFRCAEGCGAGLVNVHAALLRTTGAMPMGPPRLSLSSNELFFTTGLTTQSVTINNPGGMPLTVSFTPGGAQGMRVTVMGSAMRTVAPGQSETVQFAASLQGLPENMTAAATISVTSNGGNASIGVKLRAGGAAGRPIAVALIHQVNGEWKVAGEPVEATAAQGFAFTVSAPPGKYFLFAAQDANGNNQFEDDEPVGLWPNTDSPKDFDLPQGSTLMERNFVVAPAKSLDENAARLIGTACTDDSTCGMNGVCATAFPDGYCTKDCAQSSCPAGARCLSGASASICLDTCPAPRRGRSTCRASYVCEDDGAGGGLCIPTCNSLQDFCEAPQQCNATSGYCE